MSQLCFCQRSTLSCIDTVRPGSEPPVGTYSGETLEQMQTRYPGAELLDLAEFVSFKEQALLTAPVEITEDRFIEMLEVLPPQRWIQRQGSESFQMQEHLSGRVTETFCRIGSRYFCFNGIAGMRHEDIVAKCRTTHAE